MSETALEVELALDHRCRLAVVLGICLMLFRSISALLAVDLEYTPQLKPAPLKGLLYTANNTHTLDWYPVSLHSTMLGPNEFEWKYVDKRLETASAAGKTVILRPAMDFLSEYPRLPCYLTNIHGATYQITNYYDKNYFTYPTKGIIPVYTNEATQTAMMLFIRAFGARYDGDPRIAFLEVGLIGSWGEWYNINLSRFPLTTVPPGLKREILQTYSESFKKTKVVIRWPEKEFASMPFGYHDDWFAFWKIPDSLHKWETRAGPEALDRWKTHPIISRLHPEYNNPEKNHSLPPNYFTKDNILSLIQRDHLSCIRLPYYNYGKIPTNVVTQLIELAPKLGYELYVPKADWKMDTAKKTLQLSVTITNSGVAPFYYPWKMEAGLSHNGSLQETWPLRWDITQVIPGEAAITYKATLPDFAPMQNDAHLLIRVINPLKAGPPLRFANTTQDTDLDGWLTLDTIDRE